MRAPRRAPATRAPPRPRSPARPVPCRRSRSAASSARSASRSRRAPRPAPRGRHGRERGHGEPQSFEQRLLEEPVLRKLEGLGRREHPARSARNRADATGTFSNSYVTHRRRRRVGQRALVVVVPDDRRCDARGGRIRRRVQHQGVDPDPRSRFGQHHAELAAAHDPDERHRSSGSGGRSRCPSEPPGTSGAARGRDRPRAPRSRPRAGPRSSPRSRRSRACRPARRPASARSTAASPAFSAFDSTGTPSTGRWVFAAVMPGRCAAPPAPATITCKPAIGGGLRVLHHQLRRAMGRDDLGLEAHPEVLERVAAVLHRLPVGAGAHDHADLRPRPPTASLPARVAARAPADRHRPLRRLGCGVAHTSLA